jgi:hypothetical protein
MEKIGREVLELVNLIEIIESHVHSWWRKYVNGVNLTFTYCDERLPNCSFPKKDNTFYMIVNPKYVSLNITAFTYFEKTAEIKFKNYRQNMSKLMRIRVISVH